MGLFTKQGLLWTGAAGGIAYLFRDSITAVAKQLGLTPLAFVEWLESAGRFLIADVRLSRWELWVLWSVVLLAAGIGLLACLAWLFPNSPQRRYRGDTLEDIRWRWTYSGPDEVRLQGMYCPKCYRQLRESEFRYATPGPAGPLFAVTCKCGYTTTCPPFPTLRDTVRQEAERNIRTGDWKLRPNKLS
jgi:hypothetical protein